MTKKGFHVLRMGKKVNEKMVTQNPMIIDYATSEFRSDILDIYLHSKCTLCVTTGLGIDSLSKAFRKPIAAIVVPYGMFNTFKNYYLSSKHHIFGETGHKLTLSEIFELGCADFRNQNYKKIIKFEDLNENEINDFVLEVLDIIQGKFIWSENDKNLQNEFWSKYQNLINKYNIGYLHNNYEAIFSPIFLRKNLQLLK